MKRKESWLVNIKNLFTEFTLEQKSKNAFEVVGIEKNGKGETEFVIQLHGHLVKNMTPQEIILDDSIVDGLSSKETRAITYLAVLEKLAPENKLISWELDQVINEYIVTLQNNKTQKNEKISASQVSKDKNKINKLTPEDANKIGYMAGINDTIKDNIPK